MVENKWWNFVDFCPMRILLLYQIPVMKVDDLEYGEYTAVIKVFYNSFFDHQKKNEYSFWLDIKLLFQTLIVLFKKDSTEAFHRGEELVFEEYQPPESVNPPVEETE